MADTPDMTATPADLLGHAKGLLSRATPETRGLWPRAAALLTRQALEQALDEYWQGKGLRVDECSTTAQLLCLAEYLNDENIALEAHHVWSALSRACHHHPYELAPTAGELEQWVSATRRLTAALSTTGPATRETAGLEGRGRTSKRP